MRLTSIIIYFIAHRLQCNAIDDAIDEINFNQNWEARPNHRLIHPNDKLCIFLFEAKFII